MYNDAGYGNSVKTFGGFQFNDLNFGQISVVHLIQTLSLILSL